MNQSKLFWLSAFLFFATTVFAEYTNPAILSFENGIAPAIAGKGSRLSVTTDHYKHGGQSLQWTWKKKKASWSIDAPIAYEKVKTVNTDNSIYSFVFWVYSSKPVDGSMRVEFLKDGQLCSWFDYGLNFSGWRGAWIAFDRDMQGSPQEGMNEIRMIAPEGVKKGELFFDHVILSSLQDSRYHTADFQAPYINAETNSHWLILLHSWRQNFDMPLAEALCADDVADMQTIAARLDELLLNKAKASSMKTLVDGFRRYHIRQLPDGRICGLPVFFERFGETYEHWGAYNYAEQIGEMGVVKANQLLLNMAVTFRLSGNQEEKRQIQQMFITLIQHLLDQGFQAGSAMGTLHHLGYSMRHFYTATYLMREPLAHAGLLEQVQQAAEWFSGAGEVKTAPVVKGMDIDAFNTNLTGRLASILMLADTPEKVRYMRSFSRWVDNGLQLADGLLGSFKVDGTVFHHCNHYPAYAVGGLDGAVNALWLLHHTAFALGEQGHENLKQSLLAMRIYCNQAVWPLSLSGRHPDGKGQLVPWHFGQLALCGSPDGSQPVDADLAQAYLRLNNGELTALAKQMEAAGFTPEEAPQGNRAFPYSCLDIHRRHNWMVAIKGYSRYIWNTETYRGANLYGRYLNYGNVQILANGLPVDNFASGFRQEGWDWNHFPGTTATVLPIADLHADIKNLDANSGYEEMLHSDESFCNALSLNGQGVWGMKLHSHDKYDGTLHARKSVFCFDNRIVALGSNICSEMNAPTQTTLFQVALNELPQEKQQILQPAAQGCRLADGLGNDFFIKNGRVEYRQSLQHSLHEETEAPTEGYFSLAAIDHGVKPENADYEYLILVQGDAAQRQQAAVSYEVLRKDSMAHVVFDKQTQTTAYVLFEPNACMENSLPCLAMTQPTENGMIISVADPDLHLYEGASDEIYLPDGKRKERIIYSYPWISNPSAQSIVTLKLEGKWQLAEPSDYMRVEQGDNCTWLRVICRHGMARQAELMLK